MKTIDKLIPNELETQFSNLRKSEKPFNPDNAIVYQINNKGHWVDTVSWITGSEWWIEIDNFPGQRKFYKTNFPIKTCGEFIQEMKRIKLEVKLIKERYEISFT